MCHYNIHRHQPLAQPVGDSNADYRYIADAGEYVHRAEIITLYVAQLVSGQRVTFVAGLLMTAVALGSILSASRLGRLADRVGHWRVIIGYFLGAAVLLIPQAFVTAGWQLVALRFCMGRAATLYRQRHSP